MTREEELPRDLFNQPYVTVMCDEAGGEQRALDFPPAVPFSICITANPIFFLLLFTAVGILFAPFDDILFYISGTSMIVSDISDIINIIFQIEKYIPLGVIVPLEN